MENSIISIIVPVYNNEKDLQETINSIKQQTYNHWEAIFVDDGSTDKSEEIIHNNIASEKRIKYIKRNRQPKGGSTCRNIGVASSIGDYLIFLDGDDVLAPTCLENRFNAIKDSDYDFMVFPMSMFTTDVKKNKRLTKWGIRDFDYYYITGAPAWQVTSPIYRRTFWEKLNGFDEKFTRSQDIELGIRAVLLSHGNFKSVENIDSDCFYRRPASKDLIPSSKLTNQLESYEYMLGLIKKLKNEGYFSRRYKFSLGLLATYSQIYQLIYLVKSRKENTESFDYYNKTDLRCYMLLHHKFILAVLGWIPLPFESKRALALKINQYCRWHFLY